MRGVLASDFSGVFQLLVGIPVAAVLILAVIGLTIASVRTTSRKTSLICCVVAFGLVVCQAIWTWLLLREYELGVGQERIKFYEWAKIYTPGLMLSLVAFIFACLKSFRRTKERIPRRGVAGRR
jgi:hypothetical protein